MTFSLSGLKWKSVCVTIRLSLFLGLSVHVIHVVIIVFLIAALLSSWHIRGGRHHSGLARTGIAVW